MFSNFELVKDVNSLTLKYQGKTFIKVGRKALKDFLFYGFKITCTDKFKITKGAFGTTKMVFSFETLSKSFKINFNKKPLLYINKFTFLRVLNFFILDQQKPNGLKAKQFLKYYVKKYKENTKRRVTPNFEDKKTFNYFVKAVELIKKHDVSFKVFLDAQIDGLSFVKENNFFPKPCNLCTPESENRLIDYLEKKTKVQKVEEGFSIHDIDLENNDKYKSCLKLIKKKMAGLDQTEYVYFLQLACLESVDDFVTEYYKSFE